MLDDGLESRVAKSRPERRVCDILRKRSHRLEIADAAAQLAVESQRCERRGRIRHLTRHAIESNRQGYAVDETVFDAVQAQLEENRRRARQRKRGARYLLQGLLACAQCQYAYYGKAISNKAAKGKTRDYAYYRCIGTDAYRFGGERICDNMLVRTDMLASFQTLNN